MKRFGFLNYDDGKGGYATRRVTRNARTRNPIQAGVVVDSGGPDDTVLELEVRDNGMWSLVERPYGVSTGTVRAEGRIGSADDS